MIGGVNVPQLGNTNVIDMTGHAYTANNFVAISGCTFTNGNGTTVNGYYYLLQNCQGTIDSCTFAALTDKWGAYVYVAGTASNMTIKNTSTIAISVNGAGGKLTLSNVSLSLLGFQSPGGTIINLDTYLSVVRVIENSNNSGTLNIASGTVIQLKGNAPQYVSAGKITVETGGCKFITTTGTTVNVPAGTYTKFLNDGTYS